MTDWDLRAFARALGAALVGLAVVWLVTAASDEGQLTAGARAGRTLPLAPLCSAVGAALALGTSRVREETLALEAIGRSPAENAFAAAVGAAIPSILLGLAMLLSARVDVAAFYPRAPRGDSFVHETGSASFVSPSLGVRVADEDGAPAVLPRVEVGDEGLPRGARVSAAATTSVAGLALALVAARAALRASLQGKRARRRGRLLAVALAIGCALATLVLFQASAAHVAPAALAIAPSAALLAFVIFGYRGPRRDGEPA